MNTIEAQGQPDRRRFLRNRPRRRCRSATRIPPAGRPTHADFPRSGRCLAGGISVAERRELRATGTSETCPTMTSIVFTALASPSRISISQHQVFALTRHLILFEAIGRWMPCVAGSRQSVPPKSRLPRIPAPTPHYRLPPVSCPAAIPSKAPSKRLRWVNAKTASQGVYCRISMSRGWTRIFSWG